MRRRRHLPAKGEAIITRQRRALPFLLFAIALLASRADCARGEDAGESLLEAGLALAARHGLAESEIAFSIVSREGILAAHRSEEPMPPASTLKLVTAAAALDSLGPDFLFRTELCASRRAVDGVLAGDLIVVGRGDPSISGRDHGGDPLALVRPWAASLRELGIRRVEGKLLGDDLYFAGAAIHDDWPEDQLHRWYCAPSAALNLNDNCVDVILTPRPEPGQGRIEIALRPEIPLFSVENALVPVREERKHRFSLERAPGSWRIRAAGRFLVTAPERVEWVTVPDPTLAFLSALHALFEAEGVEVEGGFARAPCPKEALIIEEIERPLRQLLPALLSRSQNLYGDCMLRALGRESGGDGSFASGADAARRFLARLDLGAECYEIRDGSGLSARNRLSARALTSLFAYASEREWWAPFRDALAVPGGDGTLEHRFRGSPIADAVQAKTGHTSGVATLAGLLRTPRGDVYFALFFHGKPSAVPAAREWQEDFLEAAASRAGVAEAISR